MWLFWDIPSCGDILLLERSFHGKQLMKVKMKTLTWEHSFSKQFIIYRGSTGGDWGMNVKASFFFSIIMPFTLHPKYNTIYWKDF